MIEKTDIGDLKGIGEKTKKLFEKINIHTVGDLIRYYPHGYDVYEEAVPVSELEEDKIQTVTGAIYGRVQVSGSSRMQVTTLYVKDITGILKVIWFRMPFLRNTLSGGGVITLRGRVVRKKTGDLVMEHPEIFYPSAKYEEKLHTLQPVYGLTSGLSNNMVMKAMKQALDGLDLTREILPDSLRLKYGLAEYNYAVRGIHFPEDKEVFYHARERLVFEEFLEFILSIRRLKEKNERLENNYPMHPRPEVETFLKSLPFELTGAQTKVWKEIEKDLGSEKTMSRLVQGDVGSGKTAVAAALCYFTFLNGAQSALMAPTEILAQQHYHNLAPLLERLGMRVALLTGSLSVKKKESLKAALAAGELDLCIGTHAILTADTEFSRLGLVVTDEQHRFGVQQRTALRQKGQDTHVLVMSATPIPRTLAMIVYGDLELSIIDELPAGRQPVRTYLINSEIRERAFGYIRRHLDAGYQAYLICPAVQSEEEEAAAAHLKSAVEYAEELAHGAFGQYRVGLLHGKMRPAQKEKVMAEFAAGEIQLLVATTVVEVGVDVPNAVIMMIENAERFGLSQLHQLRGRVGRGRVQSHCILLSDTDNPETKERLRVLCSTNDGFKIAEEDLKQRGPGDFFGERQHGLPELKVADLAADSRLLQKTQQAAGELLARDPQLDTLPALSRRVDRLMAKMSL